jgi:hypothetical protein
MGGYAMEGLTTWEDRAKRLLRTEMARKGKGYKQLCEQFAVMGIQEDEHNMRNKVSRGKFTAAFLLQCLEALETWEVRIDR